MKRTSTICLSSAAVSLALAGCSSPKVVETSASTVALGDLGPATVERSHAQGVYCLGAGDAIGREMFTYYLACLRAEQHFATEGDGPFLQDQ